jgi:hypothetical protein
LFHSVPGGWPALDWLGGWEKEPVGWNTFDGVGVRACLEASRSVFFSVHILEGVFGGRFTAGTECGIEVGL